MHIKNLSKNNLYSQGKVSPKSLLLLDYALGKLVNFPKFTDTTSFSHGYDNSKG